MPQLIIKIDLENAAFMDDADDLDPGQELARILHALAESPFVQFSIKRGYTEGDPVQDINGNTVGNVQIVNAP